MHCRCLNSFNRLSGADLPTLPFLAPRVFARCSPNLREARLLSTTKKRNDGPKSRNEKLASWGSEIYDEPGGFPPFQRVKAREGARIKYFEYKLRAGGLVLPLNVGDRRITPTRDVQKNSGGARDANNEAESGPLVSPKRKRGYKVHLPGVRRVSSDKLTKKHGSLRLSNPIIGAVPKGYGEVHSSNKPFVSQERQASQRDTGKEAGSKQLRIRRLKGKPQRFAELRAKYISLAAVRKDPDALNMQRHSSGKPTQRLEAFSSTWTTRFAILNARYDPRVQSSLAETRLQLPRETDSWSKALLSGGSDVEAIYTAWVKVVSKGHSRIWKNIMLWALHSSPQLALNILEATYAHPYPPGYAVADCLEYITNYYISEIENHGREVIDNLHRVLRLTLHRRSDQASSISQRTILLLLRHSSEEQVLALFDDFAPLGVLHHNTLLHFADFFARSGEHNLAYEIIHSLYSSGHDLSEFQVMSVCSTILRSSAANGRGYTESSDLLSRMLQMGLRPNLRLCNVILLNAFEGGDHETAFNIYSTIKANGLQPDAYTYSILLKGGELTGDTETIRRIINEAQTSDSAMSNSHVLTQILLHIHRNFPTQSAFHAMLSLYKKHFDTGALLDLGLNFEQIREETAPRNRPNPSKPTLGLMLTAFLERCHDPNVAKMLYKQFRRQAEAGHPTISPLLEIHHVFNAFIMAFARTQTTIHLCTTVVADMLKPLPHEVINPQTGNPIHQAEPSVQTWSILVKAFLHHRQSAAAEKILGIMKNRGIEPDQVTWNTLVSGYSRMQDIDKAVETMKRMELKGWDVDDYTLKGLGEVRDRRKLTAAFERVEGGKREDDEEMGDVVALEDSRRSVGEEAYG